MVSLCIVYCGGCERNERCWGGDGRECVSGSRPLFWGVLAQEHPRRAGVVVGVVSGGRRGIQRFDDVMRVRATALVGEYELVAELRQQVAGPESVGVDGGVGGGGGGGFRFVAVQGVGVGSFEHDGVGTGVGGDVGGVGFGAAAGAAVGAVGAAAGAVVGAAVGGRPSLVFLYLVFSL